MGGIADYSMLQYYLLAINSEEFVSIILLKNSYSYFFFFKAKSMENNIKYP